MTTPIFRARARVTLAVAVTTVTCLGCFGDAPDGEERTPLGRTATSTEGMVVSSSAPAAEVGADVLSRGGNAVDAAVATAFALAVVEPTQSGLGGRTQAFVWRPGAEPFGVDATTVVQAGHDPDGPAPGEDGYAVIAIPGTVAGLARLHGAAGSWPWADVVEPARRLAAHGFPLTGGEAERLTGIRERLLLSDGARAALLRPDGDAYAPGETVVQPELARVLGAIAEEGADVFYRGWIAEEMAADFARNGATVARSDLADYRAAPAVVVRGAFRELELVGTYLPASGATVIEALQIIERLDVASLTDDQEVVAVGEALLAAFEDRETARADARPAADDAAWVTSTALADVRASEIRGRFARGADGADGVVAEPARFGEGERRSRVRGGRGPDARVESPNTSHISVVDDEGMAVAMTQSLGPTGGSRVATPGLGFLYAATLGYLDREEPGDRPWSSQAPMVALRDGRPVLVVGGAGGRRIVSALVQTVVRLEQEGMALEEALAAPRIHPTGRWHFEQLDSTRTPAGADLAAEGGYRVLVRPFDDYFGRLNVIAIDPATGAMTGVADPRWVWGGAAGVSATGR